LVSTTTSSSSLCSGSSVPRSLCSFPTRRSSDLGVVRFGCDPLSDFDMAGPLNGSVRMARCRNHTGSRHSKTCVVLDLRRCRCLRSEEHTSELQSRENLVCRLLLEKKNHNGDGQN